MREYPPLDRSGTMPHRSCNIPFAPEDGICYNKHGIPRRSAGSRFMPLAGLRQICRQARAEDLGFREALSGCPLIDHRRLLK